MYDIMLRIDLSGALMFLNPPRNAVSDSRLSVPFITCQPIVAATTWKVRRLLMIIVCSSNRTKGGQSCLIIIIPKVMILHAP